MTTLIAVYNSDGCVGRCDAKCYEATSPDCDCICGGRNHGAGRERAVEQTREIAADWLERAGEDIKAVSVHWPQRELFGAGET